MSMIVRVFCQWLFHEHDYTSIWSGLVLNIIVRVFGHRLFNEHGSASMWSEAFYEHDSESIWPETLSWGCWCEYLVRDSSMNMVVRVFGPRLFYEHGSASIWSEAFMSIWSNIWSEALSWACLCVYFVKDSFMSIKAGVFGQRHFHEDGSASI